VGTFFVYVLAVVVVAVLLGMSHRAQGAWGDGAVGQALTRWGVTSMGAAAFIVSAVVVLYVVGRIAGGAPEMRR
jgi:hypothetical protein